MEVLRRAGAEAHPPGWGNVDLADHDGKPVVIDPHEQSRAALVQAARQPSDASVMTRGCLHPGDRVDFTAGKETFYPGRAVGFEVGPVTVSTTLRDGESAADAYARAVTSAYIMFEAEFHTKRIAYFKRLGEVQK